MACSSVIARPSTQAAANAVLSGRSRIAAQKYSWSPAFAPIGDPADVEAATEDCGGEVAVGRGHDSPGVFGSSNPGVRAVKNDLA